MSVVHADAPAVEDFATYIGGLEDNEVARAIATAKMRALAANPEIADRPTGIRARMVDVGEKIRAGIPRSRPRDLRIRPSPAGRETGSSAVEGSEAQTWPQCRRGVGPSPPSRSPSRVDDIATGRHVVERELGRERGLARLRVPAQARHALRVDHAMTHRSVFDSTRGLLGSLGIQENDASEVGQAMNALVDSWSGASYRRSYSTTSPRLRTALPDTREARATSSPPSRLGGT